MYRLLTLVYFIHEKIFRLAWKIEDFVLPYLMSNKKYTFNRVLDGAGLLHKYIMTNKINQKKYFIKKPTLLTDIWQYSQRRIKIALKIKDDYDSLTRNSICEIIRKFISYRELKNLSLVLFVAKDNVIVYKYINDITISQSQIKENEIIQKLNKYGFKYMDISHDNFLIVENEYKIIDLESLVEIND